MTSMCWAFSVCCGSIMLAGALSHSPLCLTIEATENFLKIHFSVVRMKLGNRCQPPAWCVGQCEDRLWTGGSCQLLTCCSAPETFPRLDWDSHPTISQELIIYWSESWAFIGFSVLWSPSAWERSEILFLAFCWPFVCFSNSALYILFRKPFYYEI